MSKYAARIRMGWVNEVFEGNSPCEIIKKVEKVQDLNCLVMMGRSEEDAHGQKELDKLEKFITKYRSKSLSMQDIKDLDVELGIGFIKCLGVAEGAEQIEALKA